jgi:phosphatidylglycerol:prolipoprotein diacylglycerol transferase
MITLSPQGLHIGAYVLGWFGLAVVSGTWAGIEVAARLAKRQGVSPHHIWRAMLWVLPLAIIGGRLWFVCFPPQSMVALGRTAGWMLTHFFDLNQGAVAVWTGGMGLFGAIIGGLLGIYIYGRRQGIRGAAFLPWLDIGVVGLALTQAIGRLGEWRELHGPPLSTMGLHPVWLYESALAFAIFLLLLARTVRGERRKPGDLALLYAILYGFGRALLEFLRANPALVAGVNVSQVFALGAALFALWIYRKRHDPRIPIP